MSKRLYLNLSNQEIINQISRSAICKNLSKSKLMESIISRYFELYENEKIVYRLDRIMKNTRKLNLTFNDESIIKKINIKAQESHLSKSMLVEYIIKKMGIDKINKDNNSIHYKIKKYFDTKIGLEVAITKKNDKMWGAICFVPNSVEIELFANSISLSDLNKAYMKKIKEKMKYISQEDNRIFDVDGLLYLVLIESVELVDTIIIDHNTLTLKTVKYKKYFYRFLVIFRVIKMAKILIDKTNNAQNDRLKLSALHYNKSISTELFNLIDFSSVEYKLDKEKNNNELNSTSFDLLPKLTKKQKGSYKIRLLNKPKAVNQYLKKEHIFKINRTSIVNILPIYEYSISDHLKKHDLFKDKLTHHNKKGK